MKGRRAFRAVYRDVGIDNGRVWRNGMSTEGVDSCRELFLLSERSPKGELTNIPQDYATILSTASSMFPCSSSQGTIDCTTSSSLLIGLRSSKPAIHDQGAAGIQPVWLTRSIYCVDGIQESGCRDLC